MNRDNDLKITNDAKCRFLPFNTKEVFEKIKEYDILNEMWRDCVLEYSDDVAIIYDNKSYTFKELDLDIKKFRGVLKKYNISKGDRIGIFIKNSYEFVKVMMAVTTYGAISIIIPPYFDNQAINGITKLFNLKGIIYGKSLKQNTVLAQKMNLDLTIIDANLKGEMVQGCKSIKKEDSAVVLFTLGVVKEERSKGALLSHGALMQGVVNGFYGYKDVFSQKYLLTLPLHHAFGLIRGLLTPLASGSSVYIPKQAELIYNDSQKYNPSIIVGVPDVVRIGLELAKNRGKHIFGNNLKLVVTGSAKINEELIKGYNDLGIPLVTGYGLTESAALVSGNPETLKKPDSVGMFFPNIEYKIVDGELFLKGKNMMDYYIGLDEGDTTYFIDGWFKTGDLVKIDQDGYLYIIGRVKNAMSLQSGENVDVKRLENIFKKIEYVKNIKIEERSDELGIHKLAIEIELDYDLIKDLNINRCKKVIMRKIEKINRDLYPHERIKLILFKE